MKVIIRAPCVAQRGHEPRDVVRKLRRRNLFKINTVDRLQAALALAPWFPAGQARSLACDVDGEIPSEQASIVPGLRVRLQWSGASRRSSDHWRFQLQQQAVLAITGTNLEPSPSFIHGHVLYPAHALPAQATVGSAGPASRCRATAKRLPKPSTRQAVGAHLVDSHSLHDRCAEQQAHIGHAGALSVDVQEAECHGDDGDDGVSSGTGEEGDDESVPATFECPQTSTRRDQTDVREQHSGRAGEACYNAYSCQEHCHELESRDGTAAILARWRGYAALEKQVDGQDGAVYTHRHSIEAGT